MAILRRGLPEEHVYPLRVAPYLLRIKSDAASTRSVLPDSLASGRRGAGRSFRPRSATWPRTDLSRCCTWSRSASAAFGELTPCHWWEHQRCQNGVTAPCRRSLREAEALCDQHEEGAGRPVTAVILSSTYEVHHTRRPETECVWQHREDVRIVSDAMGEPCASISPGVPSAKCELGMPCGNGGVGHRRVAHGPWGAACLLADSRHGRRSLKSSTRRSPRRCARSRAR